MTDMQKSSILIALLGVIIGAGTVITINRINERNRLLRTEYSDWRKLNLILQCVDDNYVDTVDRKKVTDAAIEAALSALDPHTVYMPPRELEDSEEDLAGSFQGIGIQFNVPNDTAIIIEVIPGGPSEKVGLLAGDRILKVGDTDIAGVKFPQDSMVRRMKGPAGTKVTVTVGRDKEIIPFEITRGTIPTHSVTAAFMVSDTTGYIRLSKFSRTTALEFAQEAIGLQEKGMRNLVVDLRENTGGFFDQALMLSNMFLPKGAPIVYMEGLHRKREDYNADGSGILKDLPLTLLIDEGSASSSEIFAGAMQDNGRARLVGRRSFGKGLVQEPFNFTDGSGVRITVARFHTPSGRCIQKPYADDYDYDIYHRYESGEMVAADSMDIAKGGIIPDVFVPVDTTKVDNFYIGCNRKATAMRFASHWFDTHKARLQSIDDYDELLSYLDSAGLEQAFLAFAQSRDGLKPSDAEWKIERSYMMTQVYALVGRYSKLGDNAFYHLYLQIDDTFKAAIAQ